MNILVGFYYTDLYIWSMKKPNNSNPFPIRLGELKPILQQEASQNDRSLHYWVVKILKEYVKTKPKQ